MLQKEREPRRRQFHLLYIQNVNETIELHPNSRFGGAESVDDDGGDGHDGDGDGDTAGSAAECLLILDHYQWHSTAATPKPAAWNARHPFDWRYRLDGADGTRLPCWGDNPKILNVETSSPLDRIASIFSSRLLVEKFLCCHLGIWMDLIWTWLSPPSIHLVANPNMEKSKWVMYVCIYV